MANANTRDPRCGVKSAIYCKFIVTYESNTVHCEVCEFCGKKLEYRKVEGRMDNRKYLRDHVRDFLQKKDNPELFRRMYGDKVTDSHDKAMARIKEKHENKISDEDFLKDVRSFYRSLGRTYFL